MNPDDLFGAPGPEETEEGLKEAKDKAESKDKLYDEVDNLDRQRQEELEPVEEKQKPMVGQNAFNNSKIWKLKARWKPWRMTLEVLLSTLRHHLRVC